MNVANKTKETGFLKSNTIDNNGNASHIVDNGTTKDENETDKKMGNAQRP